MGYTLVGAVAVAAAAVAASYTRGTPPPEAGAAARTTSRLAPAPVAERPWDGVPLFHAGARIVLSIPPVDAASGDSVRTILARDLRNSDRVQIASAGDIVTPNATLRVTPSSAGLAVAVVLPDTADTTTTGAVTGGVGADPAGAPDTVAAGTSTAYPGVVQVAREFPVPSVPQVRTAELADSLARLLGARDSARQLTLESVAVRLDSLAGERERKPPRFWTRGARRAWERSAAVRDSLYRADRRVESDIRDEARRDTAAQRAILDSLVARAAVLRDSLAAERRWAIHGIADEVLQWLTGIPGVARSRVAYVAAGRVRVADADGANDRAVTRGAAQAMSPAWRPDGNAIVFTELTDAGTRIAWVDLRTGEMTRLTSRGPLNITPVFTPDGASIIFAASDEAGRIGLVIAPASGSAPPRRISRGTDPWDEESPALSPDGTRVAFISSRPRTPQIYSMRLDGSDERIETPVTGKRRSYRTSPDWSPDGRTIAFEQQNGDFQLWLVDRQTRRMRRLTTVGENEDPSWAPDSRHLAFTSNRGGSKAIWVLDVDTGRMRQLTPGGSARLAAWSPVIPTASGPALARR